MRIACATAEVAFDAMSDFFAGGSGGFSEQLDASHDHAGSAVAALETVTFPKAFLDGMKFAVLSETFDGGDFQAVGLDGEHCARLYRLAVLQNGACAANTGFATDMRAGKFAMIAQIMDKERARLDFVLLFDSVDIDGDQTFHTAPPKLWGFLLLAH